MPYIGRTPANAAITADDLNNGIVTATNWQLMLLLKLK